MTNIIYKLESAGAWQGAQAAGSYSGSPLDKSDGFIHLSSASQVRETAGKWFTGQQGLVLVGVDGDALGETLKWEASRDGALFPHVYGDLPMSAVTTVVALQLDANGLHIFGPEIA